MNAKRLRAIIPVSIVAIAGIGYVAHTGFGNLSALGWESISILCPLGALGTMLASKTIVPRAVISLVLAVVAIIIFGRAFCGWVCPVPVVSKLREAFAKQTKAATDDAGSVQEASEGAHNEPAQSAEAQESPAGSTENRIELSEKEKLLLRTSCGHAKAACSSDCRPSNSRHLVLGSALLSAAIFGFPVFCLVCPIGLSFALVFVLINLFGSGDVTWSVIVIPVLLIAGVVFFRKWCSHICPLSSLMSLIGKLNRTFRPHINDKRCIESHGGTCGRCAQVCEVGINPRHPELGSPWSECTKCRACVEVCPSKALSMPLVPRREKSTAGISGEGAKDGMH